MSAPLENLSKAVGSEACHELDEALQKINHCVNQITDDQLWWRPSESMNSVANLLLHLCGNLRQWIVSGVGGVADVVAHFRGHAQEIVHMTRCQLGDSYEFDFVPTTTEEGAAEE